MVKKRRVCVVIPYGKSLSSGESMLVALASKGIKAIVVNDSKFSNVKSYPYYTINDKKICLRRLLIECKRGNCL